VNDFTNHELAEGLVVTHFQSGSAGLGAERSPRCDHRFHRLPVKATDLHTSLAYLTNHEGAER
jgi:hypothetical protein